MRWREIILESVKKYLPMFGAVFALDLDDTMALYVREAISGQIANVEKGLLREDRIVWYLRWSRLQWVHTIILDLEGKGGKDDDALIASAKKLWQRYSHEIGVNDPTQFDASIRIINNFVQFQHFANTPAPKVQSVVWDRQSPARLVAELQKLEKEWADERKQEISHDHNSGEEVFLDFHNGWAWYDLKKHYCSKESNAMGHCGNAGGDRGDTILSLRRRVGNTKGLPPLDGQPHGMYRPSLTFILDPNGVLGEMKGRANRKPAERYHDMIIALLRDPRITGIKGGGYEPFNNFSMRDLPDDVREKLTAEKPGLLGLSDMWWIIRDQTRVQKREADPDLAEKFKSQLLDDIEGHGFIIDRIDLDKGDIVIDSYPTRDSYLEYNTSYCYDLKELLTEELPHLITTKATGISLYRAEGMANAVYIDRFNKLFDDLLHYDHDYALDGISVGWHNSHIEVRLDISEYLDKFHGEDAQSYTRMENLSDVRDYHPEFDGDEIYDLDDLDRLFVQYVSFTGKRKKVPPEIVENLVRLVMKQYRNANETRTSDDYRQSKLKL